MHSHLLFVFPASGCMVKGISVATSVHFLGSAYFRQNGFLPTHAEVPS